MLRRVSTLVLWTALVLMVGLVVGGPGPAEAVPLASCSEADLRAALVADAVIDIADGCKITISGAAGEDANASGDFDIGFNVTIQGAGPDRSFIDGGGIDRLFDLLASVFTVTIRNLTIQNGNGIPGGGVTAGGCIFVGAGMTLILENVIVRDCLSTQGGGIFVQGNIAPNTTLTVTNSTFTGNEANDATLGGGALDLSDDSTTTITNSTISGNTAAGIGGGIARNTAALTLTNSTIAFNTAAGAAGGGGVNLAANMVAINSIIANNTATAGVGNDCVSSLAATSANTIVSDSGGGICLLPAGQGNQPDVDPLLLPLANNGAPTGVSPTLTHAIQGNSPAVNAGDPASCPPSDQRGVARSGACDIGAHEHDSTVIIAGYVNQVSYAPGETLTVGVNALNSGAPLLVDVYAVILPPAGVVPGCVTSAAFVIIGGAQLLCADTTPFAQFPALASNVALGTMTTPIVADIFSIALAGAPPGVYEYIVLVVDAGAAADGVFTAAEIKSISRITWFVI